MAPKKKRTVPATTQVESASDPSRRQFTLTELLDRTRAPPDDAGWADRLATEAGLETSDILDKHGGLSLFESEDFCYLEGCAVIVELLALNRVSSKAPDLAKEAIPEYTVLREIQNLTSATKESREQLDHKLKELNRDVAALQQCLEEVKAAPSIALRSQETKQESRKAVLIAGLVPEGVGDEDALKEASKFIKTEVRPAVEVEVVSVSRMGKFSEAVQGSRRLKVEFATASQASAVLRAAYHLKTYNLGQKSAGKGSVGIDPFLTKEEVGIKHKLKQRFDQERARGTPKVFFRGCHLFVNGREVKP